MGKRKRDKDELIQEKVKATVEFSGISSKFSFIRKAKSVLDLCAATGGWMHLAVARIRKGGFVLGVDLHPITLPVSGAISIQGDINTSECRHTIREYMGENGVTGFDVVMRGVLSSDPHATAWDQASVLTKSIRLATKFLSLDGTFVTKMFDGAEDYNPMLYYLEQLFCKVVVTKPTSRSAETYIVALGYKAPEKIDRHLLVPRNLFVINGDIPRGKKYSSGKTSTRIHGTTGIGIVVDGIDGGIVVGADGLLIGSGTREEKDLKVKPVGPDISCAMSGDYDFTETLLAFMNKQVWSKLNAKQSRPSVKKCAHMLKSWYSDYLTQGDKFDQMWQKSVGKDAHAFMILGGYEDVGGDELVPHLWSATKLGARRESKYCCIGSGAPYAEVLLKKKIKKCRSVAAAVSVMEKCFLKSCRYDCRTGGTFTISIIRPPSDLGAVRRLPPYRRIMGNIDESSVSLTELKTRYNDDFDDLALTQTYEADRWT